jgi:hypothetical protein
MRIHNDVSHTSIERSRAARMLQSIVCAAVIAGRPFIALSDGRVLRLREL